MCCSNEINALQKKKSKNESMTSKEGFKGGSGRRGKRKRREMLAADSDEEDGGGASWEGVRKGRGGEEEGEMHYLLPLKTRGKLVLQPPVPTPSGMVCVCVRACVCVCAHPSARVTVIWYVHVFKLTAVPDSNDASGDSGEKMRDEEEMREEEAMETEQLMKQPQDQGIAAADRIR